MKKTIIVIVCLFVVLAILIVGCGVPSPEVALVKYWQALVDKDITTAYSMRCRADRNVLDIDDFQMVVEEINFNDISYLEIKKTVITGDNASIEFYNSDQGKTYYWEMVFEDNEWKCKL